MNLMIQTITHTYINRKQDNGLLEQWQSLFLLLFLLWIIRQSCVLSTVILHYDILGMHYIAKIYKYIAMYSHCFSENFCVAQTSHSYETRIRCLNTGFFNSQVASQIYSIFYNQHAGRYVDNCCPCTSCCHGQRHTQGRRGILFLRQPLPKSWTSLLLKQ